MLFKRAAVIVALTALWFLPTISTAEVARVSSHKFLAASDYQRELNLEIGVRTIRFLLNPSSVTAETVVLDEAGESVPYVDEAFTGILDGEKNSWARLSINSQRLNGVYSQDGRQYEIKTSPFGKISVQPLADQHSAVISQKRNILAAIQKPVTRIADIAIVVDSQYDRYFGGDGVQKAISIINAVDGIYREEFGLALRIKKVITVNDPNNDPFNYGSVSIERMLRNFRQYRLNSQNLHDVSLVHLFTGNQNTDEPVGLAWINTACRSDGYDVGISTPYRYDVLLAAHEIAHNLGAQHDTDTSCASELDKVMWPYISLNTSQNFSSCTLESVRQSLANSCHAETIDLQVSLNQTSSSTMEVIVKNNDDTRANPAATLTVELPESSVAAALDSRCIVPGNDIECNIGTLLAGQEERMSFTLVSTPGSDRTAEISVENTDYADPQPLNNHARLLLNNGVIVSFLEPQESLPGIDAESKQLVGLGGFGFADVIAAMSALFVWRRRQKMVQTVSQRD